MCVSVRVCVCVSNLNNFYRYCTSTCMCHAITIVEIMMKGYHNYLCIIILYMYIFHSAVTCYTPSVVALSDLLRTQLSITRSLLARSRQLAASVSGSISADYHYTTLEETKEVIVSLLIKAL